MKGVKGCDQCEAIFDTEGVDEACMECRIDSNRDGLTRRDAAMAKPPPSTRFVQTSQEATQCGPEDPTSTRPATIEEVRAYLLQQSGILEVELATDGVTVQCSRLSTSGQNIITWSHTRLARWTVRTTDHFKRLDGPAGLGWLLHQ